MSKAQEYLEQIRAYDEMIKCKLLLLKKLDAEAGKITSTMKDDIVTFSQAQDKLGEATSKFLDSEKRLYLEIDYYLERLDEAQALLDKLAKKPRTKKEKPVQYYKVLYRRYVLYYSFGKIAANMNYSEKQIYNIHDEALKAFEKLMVEEQ